MDGFISDAGNDFFFLLLALLRYASFMVMFSGCVASNPYDAVWARSHVSSFIYIFVQHLTSCSSVLSCLRKQGNPLSPCVCAAGFAAQGRRVGLAHRPVERVKMFRTEEAIPLKHCLSKVLTLPDSTPSAKHHTQDFLYLISERKNDHVVRIC